MEIKSVKEINNKKYPTIEEMDTKILKKNMPNRWLESGITMAIFTFLIEKTSFANSKDILNKIKGEVGIETAGVQKIPLFNPTLPKISIFMIVLSIFIGVISKLKKKKGIQESKLIKTVRIIFWILTILVFIQTAIYLNDYYGWK